MMQLDEVTRQKLLQAILQTLERGDCPDSKWPDKKGDYWPLSPFRADQHSGSFAIGPRGYIDFASDAKGNLLSLAKQQGIDWQAIVDLDPAQPSGSFTGCTLGEYAQAKRLDAALLKFWGLSNGQHYDPVDRREKPAVVIPYKDEQGLLLGERHRVGLSKDGDRFRWRKGDSAQGLLYGLWRMPEIRRAGWVILVEGESDCHTLWAHDIPALGIPGVETWKDTAAQYLDGLAVYAWDERDHGAEKLLTTLAKAPLQNLQGISHPNYKDVSEAHLMGEDIPRLIEQAKASARRLEASQVIPEHDLTELMNARRLVTLFGQHIRYVYEWGWLAWTGKRWERDTTGAVMRYAKETALSYYQDAAQAAGAGDSAQAKEFAQHAHRSQTARAIRAMVELAQSELEVVARPEDFDRDPWLLNCENGTLDLRTGELLPHDPADLLTKLCPVTYDPASTCPTWTRFQSEIAGECAAIVSYKQRMYGYCLTGDVSEQAFFIAYGTGANGKSTEVNTIRAILGPDYAWHIPTESLLTKAHGGGIPNDLARLKGMRFVTAIESDLGRRLAEGLIKQLTGGDPITARFMRAEFFTFDPTHKLILATNHKPEIWGSDHAIWRRIKLIPYTVTIPKARQDKDLPEKLQAEASGILAWLVRGCLDWQVQRLAEPAEVNNATNAYRQEQDVIGDFLGDRCLFKPTATVTKGELYKAYLTWCECNKEPHLSKRKFSGKLTERGDVGETRGTGGVHLWVGIGLLTDSDVSDVSDPNSLFCEEKNSLREANSEITSLTSLTSLEDPDEIVPL